MKQFVRATVPLFYADFATEGRLQLAPQVVLAALDEGEAKRIISHHEPQRGTVPTPGFRLEIFFSASALNELDYAQRAVKQALYLLTCVSDRSPMWFTIPVDRYVEGQGWKRSSVAWTEGGHRPGNTYGRHAEIVRFFGYNHFSPYDHWRFAEAHVKRWGEALCHWPQFIGTNRLNGAVEYLALAIADLMQDQRRALVSCTTSLEMLLGDARPELSHRMSQRLGQLLAKGASARAVYRKARSWYTARSNAVHSAVEPDPGQSVDAILHVRAALFAMGRLVEIAGSHKNALAALDDASFVRCEHLLQLESEALEAWWRFDVQSTVGPAPGDPREA